MALTATDLARLDAAIAAEEFEVEAADGTRVKFRTISELLRARAHVATLVAASDSSRRTNSFRFTFTTSRE